MTQYPEGHIDTIRRAVETDSDAPVEVREAVHAALFLLAAFLVDVRRIADALTSQATSMQESVELYRQGVQD
ncbi:hypothetical protein EVB41_048 [Rhizobium phage RHph_TM3_14A]|nr:hypothetical protein EVB29_048 [Rhizobium phage RHph_TM27A]QIG66968.1 hypothetical protein EVB30_048 [Rhizobium phage RHph_TM27B]QIG67057.1 hypothetical protein EVB31_047 [Rhizobium phage RHph_TM29]QIG67513.1 hypothetical protein EVB41_048 [Rhizobium phage RHph_TM3_14A]